MNANAVPILAIFEKKVRLEVPLFQRAYVWNQEHQWEPLWEDIARKFTEHLQDRLDAPVHFLGAMVLDQKATPTTHVERRQIIDGQQRLTTLQLFLAAFRDFCSSHGCEELAVECRGFTLNSGMMADPTVDRFKVWPTQTDRDQFTKVMSAESRSSVEKSFPLTKKKYARAFDPRPRMVEAYLYFSSALAEFFLGTPDDLPLASDRSLADRLEIAFTALKNSLRVVVIDLEKDDDAQVIFETLNARGEPLLPADLLRNYIFLRAGRAQLNQEALYADYWQKFDDFFWRQEVRQGRLRRPRSDLFIQHYLASKQGFDIPIKHLFVEYKYWIDRRHPFESVTDELKTLVSQGLDYRRVIQVKDGDPLSHLARFLDAFDTSTVYPLLLHILNTDPSEEDLSHYAATLESYLLRRAVCGLTTKNYNKIFLNLTRVLQKEGTSPSAVTAHLLGLTGDSAAWPTDAEFQKFWDAAHAYMTLNNPKLVYIFKRLNETYLTNKHEDVAFGGQLTIEHLLPQAWVNNWPLLDGSIGLTYNEILTTPTNDARSVQTSTRNALLQTLGNLTILTSPLNSSVSNGPWDTKRSTILTTSLLPLNQVFHAYKIWDEDGIRARGNDLFKRALKLWPKPENPRAGSTVGNPKEVSAVGTLG
ncbi:DUF262 domain-containing protein [Edaphobacter bradus]|uniref:DUF262 domain-containing protein n=1 Tax=Edaphobacter bradus TaxID=2259016 RepID=UPI0021E0BC1A|nr:DUF262 domain-containing protein [Edaphobacter bradus]